MTLDWIIIIINFYFKRHFYEEKDIWNLKKPQISLLWKSSMRYKCNWQSRTKTKATQYNIQMSEMVFLLACNWFQYLVLLRSLFVGWFSILSHFSNRIYLSALRVTACLFSVEIIPIDTKKRKMPESLVFTQHQLGLGLGWGGSATPGEEMMRPARSHPSFLSSEILNLKQKCILFLFELEIALPC